MEVVQFHLLESGPTGPHDDDPERRLAVPPLMTATGLFDHAPLRLTPLRQERKREPILVPCALFGFRPRVRFASPKT